MYSDERVTRHMGRVASAQRANTKGPQCDVEVGSRLRVLYVTNQLPFPALSGGQVRESECLRELSAHADIDLVVLTAHFDRDVANMKHALSHCSSVSVYESTPPSVLPAYSLPRRMLDYSSDSLLADLVVRCGNVEYDLIHCEGYFLVRHIPELPHVPLVLVAENVEYLIDEASDLHPDARIMEQAAWRRSAILCAVSEQDAEIICADFPDRDVVVTGMGFDHLDAPTATNSPMNSAPRVTFVGNFSWLPTRLGAERLLQRIWPLIANAMPTAELWLVGDGADASLRSLAQAQPRVVVTETVESVRPYLEACDVFLSPVPLDTGVKVKIAEALRMGCAIVATEESITGLPPDARSAVRLARTDQEMAAAVVDLLLAPESWQALRLVAREYACKLPTWSMAAFDLLQVWRRVSRSSVRPISTPQR